MFDPLPIPKRAPWLTQMLVIGALMRREMSTRFGEYKLGFFWMFFEPLLGVLVIGLIIGTLAQRTVPEIPYAFFLLNGMLMLKVFTGPLNSGVNAIGSNTGLLVYPTVKPLDTFIARFLFDLLTTLLAFLLFCIVGMFFFGVELALGNLHVILGGFVLTWMCGCGFGLMFGVAAFHYKEVDKIVMILQRPLLFMSAVLFPLSAVPTSVQKYLLFNPIVHCIEVCRNALFPFYGVPGPNLFYPAAFAIVVLSIGLTLFHGSRNLLSMD